MKSLIVITNTQGKVYMKVTLKESLKLTAWNRLWVQWWTILSIKTTVESFYGADQTNLIL